MNDLEAKLRSLAFREPPPGWRGSIVGATVAEPAWRKWLAPHPAAWAALAATWILLAAVSQMFDKPSSKHVPMAKAPALEPLPEPSLFAFQSRAITELEPPL